MSSIGGGGGGVSGGGIFSGIVHFQIIYALPPAKPVVFSQHLPSILGLTMSSTYERRKKC